MFRYSAFSLVIDSELELPELPPGTGAPDVTIRRGSVDRVYPPATIDDEVAFPKDIGGFHIRGGREIVVDLLPQADSSTVQKLLAGRMMGYILRQRGYLPLHASAVRVNGRGVLFLGDSGTGKSTTAAAFHVRGHGVLADDVTAVRTTKLGLETLSAWPGLRLLEESKSVFGDGQARSVLQGRKYLFRLNNSDWQDWCPVKRIYLLEFDGAVRSSPLSKLSAVALLNTHSLLRDWRAGETLRQINLNRCAAVADAQVICQLFRPHSLPDLPFLIDFVEKDVLTGD